MSPVRWLWRKLRATDLSWLLRGSAALTLIALGLMVWSMAQPTPMPVMLAMTVGQALGTVAFALYGYVVIADLWRIRRARRGTDAPAPPAAAPAAPADAPAAPADAPAAEPAKAEAPEAGP